METKVTQTVKDSGPRAAESQVKVAALGLRAGWRDRVLTAELGPRHGRWTYRAARHLDDLWTRNEDMSSGKSSEFPAALRRYAQTRTQEGR